MLVSIPLLVLTVTAPTMAHPSPPAPVVDACDGTGKGPRRIVELRDRDGALLVFGGRHETDPDNPVFLELEQRAGQLDPTLILHEGGSGPPRPDRARAIATGGFPCWLAGRRGIPCESLDLSESEEARRLAQRHPPDEVLMFLVVRVQAYFNGRPADQRPPGDLVDWAVRRYRDALHLPAATAADVAATFERVVGRPWRPGELTTEIHDPRRSELATQRMSQESNALREPYMIDCLLESSRGGARVLAIVGEGHVCRIQDELRERWRRRAAP